MEGAKLMAWYLRIQLGISSGPIALLILMAFSSLVTVSLVMIYVTGTLQLVGRVPMSRGFSSLQADSKNDLISLASELIFPSHNEEERRRRRIYPDQRVQWLELLGPRRSARTEADLSPYNT